MRRNATRQPGLWPIDLAGLLACAALTAVAFAVIVRPVARQRSALARDRVELERTRLREGELVAAQARLREELARVEEQLAASPIKLEPTHRLNQRLAFILDIASASGLVVNETRSGDVVSGERYDTVPIELTGLGSFAGCTAFLRRLTAKLPDVEVVGLEMTSRPASPESMPAFTFNLAWYATGTLATATADEEGR